MGMFSTLVGSRLPPRYQRFFKLPPRVESWKAQDTAGTVLGQAVGDWFAAHDAPAGVYRLDSGRDALGARIGLIERAQRSIDIQSYLIKDDLSGNLIALRLAAAARWATASTRSASPIRVSASSAASRLPWVSARLRSKSGSGSIAMRGSVDRVTGLTTPEGQIIVTRWTH